jgi:hypothetical protein
MQECGRSRSTCSWTSSASTPRRRALATPVLILLLWSHLGSSSQDTAAAAQDEQPLRPFGRKIGAVGAVLIATSAVVLPADAQQSRRPLIEECLEQTFGRSGGKETAPRCEACLDRQPAAQR